MKKQQEKLIIKNDKINMIWILSKQGERKMNYPYFKVSASEETKEIFNNFYNQNKGVFGSKANMFRVMVSNLPVLASPSNNKFNDSESIKFEQKIQN
ncbi:hypothetical protein LOS20_09345 [Enterococcus faecium]|nr:hypothetical protein [Enterococcus faecium]